MRLLYYAWGDYLQTDFYDICSYHNITYKTITWNFKTRNEDDAFLFWFTKNIDVSNFDALVSINYLPLLAQAAYQSNLPYIACCYDNPLNVIRIEETLGYPTNHVYFYDRVQYLTYKNLGFETVYHLPLGVNSRRLRKIHATSSDHAKYDAEVSFVGNLYNSKIAEILSCFDAYHKGYLQSLMEVQSKLYGSYLIDELLTPSLLDSLQQQIDSSLGKGKLELSREALSFALASEVTRKERLVLINLLGKRHDFKFYSYDKSDLIKTVKQMGAIDYATKMPIMFQCSKVNLNPMLKIIQSGVSLRAFDIMGAGGFLLSSWQPELNEMYVDGQDLVMYSSIEDAIEKCAFYLQNEELRKQITENGRRKTLEEHNLDDYFQTAFEIAGIC